MNQEPESESAQGAVKWVMVLVLAPLLYVLSVGPVGAISKRVPASSAALRRIYYPVIWLHDHTPLERPLEMYVNLWGWN